MRVDPTLTARIGEHLRTERLRHQLSLENLAERTDRRLSKSRISHFGQGIRRMSVEAA